MILPQPLASFCTSIFWKALSTHLKVLVLTSLENAVKHAKAFETAQLEQTRLHSHPDTPAACISDYKNYQNGPSSLPNNPKPDKGTLNLVLDMVATFFMVKRAKTITQQNALPG